MTRVSDLKSFDSLLRGMFPAPGEEMPDWARREWAERAELERTGARVAVPAHVDNTEMGCRNVGPATLVADLLDHDCCLDCNAQGAAVDLAARGTTRIVIAGGPKTGKSTLAAGLDIHGAPDGCELCDSLERGGRYSTRAGNPGDSGPCPACDSIPFVRHTDHLIHLGWSEASAAAALWFDVPGPWIVEGVAAPRALRKWLAAHSDGKPCDVLVWLGTIAHVPLTSGQAAMGRGCGTVFEEIQAELVRRGVEIRQR